MSKETVSPKSRRRRPSRARMLWVPGVGNSTGTMSGHAQYKDLDV